MSIISFFDTVAKKYKEISQTNPLPTVLTGSILQESSKTEADAVGGVVTFSENILVLEILNRDATNPGVFTVNGMTIVVPPSKQWKDGVGGTSGKIVSVTGSTSYVLNRYA